MSQFDNPYAPPEADDVEPPALAGDFVVGASQGKRVVNMLIDNVASRVISTPIALLFIRSENAGALAGVLVVVLMLGYYVFFEFAFQATLGKFATGTRVVALGGGKPTFMQIVGRTLSRFVPFEPFSFFSGKYPVGWHDRWSNTRVVDKYTLNRMRS